MLSLPKAICSARAPIHCTGSHVVSSDAVQRAWLELFDWEFVTATKAALCQPQKALHKPTRDGHVRARELWEENHRREMLLDEAADLYRECHRLAPFCNFNGNTFA